MRIESMPRPCTPFFIFLFGCTSMVCFAQTNVLTYRNDNMRTAQNLTETVLNASNVQSSTFGLLYNFSVDGLVDAEPLVVSGLTIGNMQSRNVVFAATEGDSVFAFDAQTGSMYWKVSVIGMGETTSDNRGCGQVTPQIGITSTPVIDLQSGPHGTIYVVGMTKDSGGGYHHRLHALDITTGAEEFGGPVEIKATYPGTGDNSSHGTVTFDPKQYKERTGLTLVNGVIYTSWASHCDIRPYTGWTMGYNETTLAQTSVLNLSPNGNEAAIWGAGGGLAADSTGTLFYNMANGTFDTTLNASGFPDMGDYGNAFVKVGLVNGVMTPLDYWTMDNTSKESSDDTDLGSGGVLILPDLVDASQNTRHLGTGAGKDSNLYVFDRDNMGKFDSANNGTIYQVLPGVLPGGIWSSPAWFNGNLYYGPVNNAIRSFRMTSAVLGTMPTSTSIESYPYPGASPSISANGTSNAILWAVENSSPAVLRAYDANNLATEFYNSSQAPSNRDQFGNGNKYITPAIANGQVFVGTPNSVAVFGILPLPNVTLSPSSVSFANQTVNTTSATQTITVTNSGPNALAINSIVLTGTNPGDFSETNNCPTSPTTIAVNGFCTLSVTFTPSAASLRSAAITITDNGSGSPQSAGVSGTGTPIAPTVNLAPSSINFPNQAVNTTSAAQPITVTNSGPNPLAITGIALIGSNPGDFSTTNNCPVSPATIQVNGFCTISVTFTPSAANMRSAAIKITDNGNGSPQSVALSGTGSGGGAGQTWPNGYNYQATFTVAAGQAPSAQASFPALISGTFPDFATAANAGRVSNTCTQNVGNNSTAVPCDLIFTSDAAGSVLLNWEFETYSAANGSVNVWVNVPSLNNGTVIYGWYGNPSVTTLQTTPSATWSNNFEAVYHLKENPAGTAPQMNDSTANANHATMNGTPQAGQQQPGEIDGSVNFEGDTWAGIANPANFSFERTDSFSLSGWFRIASNSQGTLLSKIPAPLNAGWGLMQLTGATNPGFAFGLVGNGGNNSALAETPAVTSGVWHHVVATYSGTSTVAGMKIYVDGVNQALSTVSNNLSASIVNAVTPAINGRAGPNQMSTDSMDEIRISTKGVVFSPAWVTANYNNQSNPGAFFTVATGLTNGGASLSALPSPVTFPNQTVNTSSAPQNITVTNNGPGAVTISAIAVTGTNSGDFSQTNNCPVSPATIAASAFCTINVTFTPSAANMRSAAITITGSSPLSVGLSGTGVASASQPWPNGYNYQATFKVGAGLVPNAQNNFAALISGTFPDFATTGNSGRISNTCTQTAGNNLTAVPCDLIFTSDAAGTVLLNWEFETYIAATGAVNIWVNVPSLSNGTVLYAWYGKTSVTTLQTTPSATWSSNFEAVYHLKENPVGAAPQLNDSTANANHASMNGAVQAGQQQPGEIDGSLNFEGNTWAGIANPANFSFERTDSFSLSGWFKIASNSTGTLLSKLPAPINAGWGLLQMTGATSPSFALGLVGNGATNSALAETPAVTSGVWHYIVATYSGTSTVAGMQIYVDGTTQPLTTIDNNLSASIVNAVTAAINGRAGPNQMSTDSMDEIRISTKGVVFSPAWVTASYNNQSNPGAFFTVATGLTNQ